MTKLLCNTLGVLLLVSMFVSCKSSKEPVEKDQGITVTYDSIIPKTVFLPIQIEYAKLLNTKPDSLQNIRLYKFIDKWMNTPYLLGGETEEGIDCSSFTQLLYIEAFDRYIERTAQKQFDSENVRKFRGIEFLEEGDFLFFHRLNENIISHVGIYLKNNKFINATSYRGGSGTNGVKISDLSDSYWKKRFVAGGKRTDL